MARLSIRKKVFFVILTSFLPFPNVTYTMVKRFGDVRVEKNRSIDEEFDDVGISSDLGINKAVKSSVYDDSTEIFHEGTSVLENCKRASNENLYGFLKYIQNPLHSVIGTFLPKIERIVMDLFRRSA